MAKVAFLGLGVMGFPMAGHLVKKGGHDVTVYNRTAAKAKQWVDKFGGRAAGTSVVPQQRIPNNRACAVQTHHSVLLSADGHSRHVVESSDRIHGGLQRAPPQLRIDLGAIGMRRRRGPHDLTGIGVADNHLAGLGRRVDSRNECHACEVTPAMTSPDR